MSYLSKREPNKSAIWQALRELLSLKGRLGRFRYFSRMWVASVLAAVLGLAFSLPFYYIFNSETLYLILFCSFYCIGIWVQIASSVKRFHDMGLGGWKVFLLMVLLAPFAYILVFVLCIWPGNSNSTRYGPPPIFTIAEQRSATRIAFYLIFGIMLSLMLLIIMPTV